MMIRQTVALFGEAEKGDKNVPLLIHSLFHLHATFGDPPKESCGIFFAIQFLLYEQELIYIRVNEEGFSVEGYLKGMRLLNKQKISHLTALCLPGVGDAQIIDSANPILESYDALMITTESDLYDYLTFLHRTGF